MKPAPPYLAPTASSPLPRPPPCNFQGAFRPQERRLESRCGSTLPQIGRLFCPRGLSPGQVSERSVTASALHPEPEPALGRASGPSGQAGLQNQGAGCGPPPGAPRPWPPSSCAGSAAIGPAAASSPPRGPRALRFSHVRPRCPRRFSWHFGASGCRCWLSRVITPLALDSRFVPASWPEAPGPRPRPRPAAAPAHQPLHLLPPLLPALRLAGLLLLLTHL